ncbi:MAG: MCE family protein [Actinomycetota bacterium]|nr:MCE family protein [Actinomycetota bacterium]
MKGSGIKLGIFTVFTILITMGLASIIGNISFFTETYEVKALFSDATGLLRGDLVKIAGVNVGQVSSFEVEDGEAVVTMSINSEYKLPENVLVEIKYRNLLGQRVVNLKRPDLPSSTMLEDGDTIPVTQTTPALDLSVVFNNLRPLIQSTNPEHINTVSRAVLEVFQGREGDLEGVLGNLGELSDTFIGGGQRLTRLITDLDQLAKLLNRESGDVRVGVDRFTELMEALADVTPTLKRAITQLDTASRDFGNFLLKNKDNIAKDLEDLAFVLGIVNDELGPLDRIAKNLKEVILATARSQSYGAYWNLYVVNLCPEVGEFVPIFEDLPEGIPGTCRK